MRFVDDFIFISTKKTLAIQFMDLIKKGIPKYGCQFNAAKMEHNLHASIVSFQWCGLVINTRDLSVKGDFSRFYRKGNVVADKRY